MDRRKVYYHGGVPGKRRGGHIDTALSLGLDYTLSYLANASGMTLGAVLYRPDRVYLTTHVGSARGYAARYKDAAGRQTPGDVYEVIPSGTLEADPDCNPPDAPGVFAATAESVTIVNVIERGVRLTRRQQNQESWPYRWVGHYEQTHAADGTVLASQEMRAQGVTDDYLALLPKWMDFSEFGNGGGLYKPGRPGTKANPLEVIEILSHLDLDSGPHIINSARLRDSPFQSIALVGQLECSECGALFGGPNDPVKVGTVFTAAIHQIGLEIGPITRFSRWPFPSFMQAFGRRHPARWTWVP